MPANGGNCVICIFNTQTTVDLIKIWVSNTQTRVDSIIIRFKYINTGSYNKQLYFWGGKVEWDTQFNATFIRLLEL